MQEISVSAEVRKGTGGKGVLSTLRLSKKVPGVIYGGEKGPVSISVNEKDMLRLMKSGGNAIINIATPEGTDKVIMKQVQRHVVSLDHIHVDFLRISMKRKLEIVVPVHLHGECKAMKENSSLLMEHSVREFTVRCLPSDIPAEIGIDVTELKLGDVISAGSIALPPGVELVGSAATMVVHLVLPKEEVVETAAPEAAAGTQPEIVAAKGKKDEEGAEGAAPAKEGAKAAAGKEGAKAPAKEGKAEKK
ncbi:MAG: 50S ribosomal protein L25 [Elusimicrobiales bacterium]|nr:50S ribosomal protein L25 [Elusimicrobiales bacterium]